MVGDVAIAEVAEEQQIAFRFRLTPYTAIPRRLSWFCSSRSRERLGTALLFSFLPTVLYWTWLGTEGLRAIPGTYASMRWAAPLSGLFITLGPWLMQQGEFIYEDFLNKIIITGADAGYRIEFLQAKVGRLDAIYYRVIVPLGAAMAISIGYVFFSIGKIAPLPSTLDQVGAVVVLAFIGPTAATGVWGAIKVLLIVETITSTAELEWSPFRTSSPAVSQVLSFAWKTGLLFSISNITVPALIVAAPLLAVPALVITWAFEVLTFAGGLLLFLLTTAWLLGMVKSQQENYLDRFAPVLERLAAKVHGIDTLTSDQAAHLQLSLSTTLTFLQEVKASSPAPTLFKTLTRAASTLLVPILIAVAQLLASRVI